MLDVTIVMYMLSDADKMAGMPDVSVRINMGQIKFIFLMKFVSDILIFIDPFTNMKEFIYEQALDIVDRSALFSILSILSSYYSLLIGRSARVLGEGHNNATRMKLDIALSSFSPCPRGSPSRSRPTWVT